VTTLKPVLLQKLPNGHETEAVRPLTGQYWPSGHTVVFDILVALAKYPDGLRVHVVASPAAKVPGTHIDAALNEQLYPGGHDTHAVILSADA